MSRSATRGTKGKLTGKFGHDSIYIALFGLFTLGVKMFWQKESDKNDYYSFILDPFILIGFAIFVVWLTVRKFYRKFGRNIWILRTLSAILLGIVWLGAGALYFDLIDMPLLGEAGRGNHFMWNSGFDWEGWNKVPLLNNFLPIDPIVDTTTPTYTNFVSPLNLLALFFFVFLYPLFLWIGIHLGYILFGRNERQTGMIELFKP